MACSFIRYIRYNCFFGIGNMVQSNSVAEAMRINFSFPALTGIVMSFLIAIVILGGVKIGKVTGYVVPIKAFFYIIAGLIIIFYHYDQIPEAFSLIFLVHLTVLQRLVVLSVQQLHLLFKSEWRAAYLRTKLV